jgi:hypothetical protein
MAKAKKKKMIKRKDGSYSQRGLWDNIRAKKGSGKKPTKEMLKQERKIKKKAKKKKYYAGGKVKEYLKGGQVKLDKNGNGVLDANDFTLLRGES